MATKPQQRRVDLTTIVLVAVIGGLLSITLHELLHITLHWGQITGVDVFPNFYTVAEVVIDVPEDYDLAAEEFLAYMVSAAVLLATAGAITRIYDSGDTRTVQQILFPDEKPPTPARKPAARKSTKKPARKK